MKPYRELKLGSLIQEELSQLLLREFDFGDVLVTILGVEVSADLLQAKIKLGVIPHEKAPQAFGEIERRSGELHHKLLKKFKTRSVPKLKFEISENSAR